LDYPRADAFANQGFAVVKIRFLKVVFIKFGGVVGINPNAVDMIQDCVDKGSRG
jgi:hypothetical protein